MTEFLAGLKAYLEAWRLIWKGRLWPLLVIPGLIGVRYCAFCGKWLPELASACTSD